MEMCQEMSVCDADLPVDREIVMEILMEKCLKIEYGVVNVSERERERERERETSQWRQSVDNSVDVGGEREIIADYRDFNGE